MNFIENETRIRDGEIISIYLSEDKSYRVKVNFTTGIAIFKEIDNDNNYVFWFEQNLLDYIGAVEKFNDLLKKIYNRKRKITVYKTCNEIGGNSCIFNNLKDAKETFILDVQYSESGFISKEDFYKYLNEVENLTEEDLRKNPYSRKGSTIGIEDMSLEYYNNLDSLQTINSDGLYIDYKVQYEDEVYNKGVPYICLKYGIDCYKVEYEHNDGKCYSCTLEEISEKNYR